MIHGNTEGQQQIWLQNCPSSSCSCPNNFTQSLLNEDSEYQTTQRGLCVSSHMIQISELFWHLVQVIQDSEFYKTLEFRENINLFHYLQNTSNVVRFLVTSTLMLLCFHLPFHVHSILLLFVPLHCTNSTLGIIFFLTFFLQFLLLNN